MIDPSDDVPEGGGYQQLVDPSELTSGRSRIEGDG
jgi:hypothetical protein